MENVSTGVHDKGKERYLRYKDKAEKSYDVLGIKFLCQNTKNKIYHPLCQTHSPTVFKSISKKWTNIQEASY